MMKELLGALVWTWTVCYSVEYLFARMLIWSWLCNIGWVPGRNHSIWCSSVFFGYLAMLITWDNLFNYPKRVNWTYLIKLIKIWDFCSMMP